jgi:hypothetical protein
MHNNLERFKKDLERLLKQADRLGLALAVDSLSAEEVAGYAKNKESQAKLEEFRGAFVSEYQIWYTEASAVVRQLLPDRHAEFVSYYLVDPKRKSAGLGTYKIQDWLNGSRSSTEFGGTKYFDDAGIVKSYFTSQEHILNACKLRFESSLLDIRQILQADLFDSEIDVSRELHKKGFSRAAGALCGVVLERHLAQVATTRSLSISKKHPTIADLNDPLKNAGVYDMPVWRNIQRLADIRNLCCHSKNREPTNDEVEELIEGTSKVTKTVN